MSCKIQNKRQYKNKSSPYMRCPSSSNTCNKPTELQTKQDYGDLIRSYSYLNDCSLKVGDPNLGQPEIIKVCRFTLLIHSSVFRTMLDDGPLGDPSGEHTHIKDVEPHIFKLMLRHMYGCLDDPKDIPLEMREDLILCADKYNVQPLIAKVGRLLMPTQVSNVFPALRCSSIISIPELEIAVTYIVQNNSCDILNHAEFLKLNDLAVEFIVKVLVSNELVIWNALVKWAEHQATITPGSSLRQLMTKPLRHIRFATMKHKDIVESVIPKNILSPEEIVQVYQAIEKNKTFVVPGLCGNIAVRSKPNTFGMTKYY